MKDRDQTPRELLLAADPGIESVIHRDTALWNGILDNSILNSQLASYISARAGVEVVEGSIEYKAALLVLLFRAEGKLITPEEHGADHW